MTESAAKRITELVDANLRRQAYFDGFQDGALFLLASALGVPDAPTPQLMGHLLRVRVEWIDSLSDEDQAIVRKMAEHSRQRALERL